MSIFNPTTLDCPHCGKPFDFQASASVNADRRPDLRTAILDGSFQRASCPHCDSRFRVEPQLNYLDVGRGQWIAAFPGAWVDQWPALEATATEAFEKAFGGRASAAEREIGDGLRPRMVFGWHGLREKLVASDAGLDDASLELTKMALMRGLDDPPLPFGAQLRLAEVAGADGDTDAGDGAGDGFSSGSGAEADTDTEIPDIPSSPGAEPGSLLLLLLPRAGTPPEDPVTPTEELRVPRTLFDEVETDADDWQALRVAVTAGLFVDLMRLTRGAE